MNSLDLNVCTMSIGFQDAANLDMQQQDALIEAEKLMISEMYSS